MTRSILITVWLVGCSGGSGSTDVSKTETGEPIDPVDYHTVELTVELTTQDIGGQRVDYYVPDDVQAMAWVFHGTNGSVETVQFVEWLELYELMLPHGFGLVMTSSQDRVAMQWDTYATGDDNPDWVYLQTVQEWLVDNTAVAADTPVVAIGFSNGGNFASLFPSLALPAGWDVRAFVGHNGGYQHGASSTPGFFVSSVNDEAGQTPERLGPVAEECSQLAPIDCPHVVVEEIALHPHRFAKLPYFTQDQSQIVFDDLVELDIVDADGGRLVDIEDMEEAFRTYEAHAEYGNDSWVHTQLRVVWATHRYASQHARAEAAWLSSVIK